MNADFVVSFNNHESIKNGQFDILCRLCFNLLRRFSREIL